MDLAEWRLASGAKYELVFPRRDGRMMTETGWGNWRDRVWDEDYPPKNLRHTHSSLMIREDKLSIVEQAYQAGHSTQVHLDTYAHLFNELKGKGSAEDAIRAARLEVRSADAQEGTG
jgi:integrase